MYQVYYDKYPLYDPRDESLILRDPDPHLAVGEAGSFSFTIDHDHPHADKLTRLKGVVSLLADGAPIFKGRIRKDTRGFELSRDIEVEGLLACLNDSVIPPYDFPKDFLDDAEYTAAAESGNVVEFFLSWLLSQHNSQVGLTQQVRLGTVTVADPNNYISRSASGYSTTMEVVKKKLVDLMGGHLLADYSGETTVLHYYAELPLTNMQPVEYGENLRDLISELDDADRCSAILPLGTEGLTIADLPDGALSDDLVKDGLLVYSRSTEEAIGGRITRVVEWKDVSVAQNLQTKASKLLTDEGARTTHTIKVKAVDFGGVGDVSRFVVGRYIELKSAPHGFNTVYPLMELEPDIFDPGNTSITLGASTRAASDIAHSAEKSAQERFDRQQIELDQQKKSLTEMVTSLQEQITSAVQTSEALIFSALERYVETSNFDEFKTLTESQLSIMSDEIALRFTETVEQITEVDGDLQRTLETLAMHFEFGLDGLVIKAGEDQMSLTLENGLIKFKKNGQQFGWWDGVDFHTGNIVVEVNERAQFGNFAAIPRSNGSLSWLKVRG